MGKACDIPEASADLVQLHGRTATAFRALGPDLHRWYAPESLGRAFVAYADMPGAMVAAGEPVAPLDQVVPVAEAFVLAATTQRRRSSFFATEGRLVTSPQLQRRLVGEQPVWNPQQWDAHFRKHRSLREQVRRARAKDVQVHAMPAHALAHGVLGRAVHHLVTRWHATQGLAPMAFLVTLDFATCGEARQCWVAVQGERLVGVLAMAPVAPREHADSTRGWLLEHLLRDPDAPNGTAELLVDHAMRTMAADGVTWATLGLAPLHGPVDAWLQWARRWSKPWFNFEGLSAFKRKLRPIYWEPIYLVWPRDEAGWRALVDGLRAFADGSLVRFAVRTLLRGPRLLLQGLAWLLVPWTLALALAPTSPWFPTRTIHTSWLVFDAALVVTLFALLRLTAPRGTRTAARRTLAARVATALALAVSVDAVLTALQAWWFVRVAPSAPSWGAWIVLLVACLGPAITAPVLWGAAKRLHVLAVSGPRCTRADLNAALNANLGANLGADLSHFRFSHP